MDTTPPAIAVYNTSSTYVASGSYINQDFGFTAVDALSGCTMYMIEPGHPNWAVYGGEFITKKAGTYHFYAEDSMGNISDVYTINFDKTAPTQRFYAGGQICFNNCHVNEKLSYVVSDNTNWGMQCFVKMPGSNHFISYISGTELSEEGTYEFYTKDRCGNISKTVKATYDITTPTITIQTNKGEVTSGAIVNAEYSKTKKSFLLL